MVPLPVMATATLSLMEVMASAASISGERMHTPIALTFAIQYRRHDVDWDCDKNTGKSTHLGTFTFGDYSTSLSLAYGIR